MAQKMQTHDEMSSTKGRPWVPRESQDYVLRSPNLERNDILSFNLLELSAVIE